MSKIKSYLSLRGNNVFRIEALSDGVFAISVTLLIMSLEVPKTYLELKNIMWQFLPFSITVSVIFLIWWQQNNFFRHYGLADSKIKLLNLVLLVVVLFYVFPLKFLFSILFYAITGIDFQNNQSLETSYSISYQDFPGLIVFFSVGYLLVWLIFFLLYYHVSHKKKLLKLTTYEIIILKSDQRDALFQMSVGVLATIAASLGWIIFCQVIFLTIPIWLIINWWFTLRKKSKHMVLNEN